ncbi:phosphoribosyltransferase-like protein [Bowmanella dokdonensis]|uniref:PRTase-CE domain-containing protein n=1 Tax=Bowmanella dokdonensis TaxID=751969 RepID=A0A939DNN3_9ALTE|nr:hypothetical protein [Bowmanella dokdonensis]MBN7825101.1 hypothetical protein [Bowmanella dokdonensis]
MFEAPHNWDIYYDDVVSKCESYISFGYWEDIELYQLRSWLSNFETDEEKYFSACILDALVYRSRSMVKSSFKNIASSIVPKFLKKNSIPYDSNIDDWLTRLKEGKKVPIRFVSVENVDNKAGKSGSVIIRDLIETLDLAKHVTQIPENVPKFPDEVKAIILVDDFAGTGSQFVDFFKKNIDPYNIRVPILYTPLAAHQDAINYIEQQLPQVEVVPVELLSQDDSFFSPINGYFRGDNKNNVTDAKAFYLEMCERTPLKGKEFLLGKGELCLTFAFHLSTPNNNLKVIYHDSEENGWSRLLYRRK